MKSFKQKRYFDNLTVEGTDVISYVTKVAVIDHKNEQVVRLGWWSSTTSKHINYVASELGYKVADVEDVEAENYGRPYRLNNIKIEYGVSDD
jgi:hypothetical protein